MEHGAPEGFGICTAGGVSHGAVGSPLPISPSADLPEKSLAGASELNSGGEETPRKSPKRLERGDGLAIRLLEVAAVQTFSAVKFAVGAVFGVFLHAAAVRDDQRQHLGGPSLPEAPSRHRDGTHRKHRLSECEGELTVQSYAPITKCARAGSGAPDLETDPLEIGEGYPKGASELALQESPCGSISSSISSISALGLPATPDKLTVVLDLDDTLICSFRKTSAPNRVTHATGSARPMVVHEIKFGRGQTIEAPIDGEILVAERPGLKRFLLSLKEFANVVLFTAGLKSYAAPVVRCIDPEGELFETVLYRDATVDVGPHKNVKDLRVLGTDLRRTVLLDNSPFSFLPQPANGVPVLPFSGNPVDQHLQRVLLPLLKHLEGLDDVRLDLRKRYCVEKWLLRNGCQLPQGSDLPEEEEIRLPAQ
mmetsp:Transcript_1703/g.4921  ORF Transcript_1703/g.4921 Transcript_1703/m.4921 type:complete len:423 (-) Transcript_1703:397-1665(-)|eukprot:CAMPEP_0117660966 /NCGR_PEP_ID=MMETSP0804-20121206/7276_1 /TAXON_ID=1074897 /ORGANISM="Tetraselmis astigmatica, Strain CCMP880" /LENGTH=422 /DNA_ID=CAMNT_0005467783 /DNA_START=1174 /DNA_END=2442 /DNA_ORIENTATION=+